MLAQGADDVLRQLVAFVDPAADLADKALLALCLRLGLHVLLVVGVGHGLGVGHDPGLGDGADEHAVGIQVHIVLHLQGHEGIDELGQEPQPVVGPEGLHPLKLICRPAGLEAVALEDGEGCGDIQAVYIQDAGLANGVVGVVLLVDGDGNAVGGIGDLADGIDDEAIVPLAVIGGDHVEAIADVEEGRQVVLVGGGILLGQVLHAQLPGQNIHLGSGGIVQGREDPDGGFRKGQVLALGKHILHDLGSQGGPGAVLHQGHRAVAEVPLGQVVDIFLHEGVHVRVVGRRGQHQLVVAEGIRHSQSHISPGQIVNHDLGRSVAPQLGGQLFHSGLGVAVDTGIGNDNALILRGVGGPQVVFLQVVAQVLLEHRTVEGADGGDIQRGRLFQQILDLGAVFAHNADVVAPGLVVPGLLHIQRAELSEAVGGEQDLVHVVIGHNDLGPMDHGGGNKGQGVLAEVQRAALSHNDPPVLIAGTEEGAHHREGLGRGDDGGLREGLHEVADIGGVVRLHMLHHQIVRLPALEHILDIVQPLVGEVFVHRIHDGDLFVQDHIGIVAHAIGHPVLPLEQVHLMVVDAYITDIVGNSHSRFSSCDLFLFAFYHKIGNLYSGNFTKFPGDFLCRFR